MVVIRIRNEKENEAVLHPHAITPNGFDNAACFRERRPQILC